MTDDALEQIKQDCERDEAKARTECFWDNLPGTILVNGVYLCESHAMCAACLNPLKDGKGFTCRCDKYGYAGHEELLYCSDDCLSASHDRGDDREPYEEES